ncbi:nitroreductase family protein [Paenibacillus eucommiae]|uniref:Nitroreductase n=1 Tax=Paenibacillus eucommiae TaxID=1355755 RepID=A0ABS4J5V6_9BACL|nr:nitroreductase family protein [Paenibacillus eucommiae]MBP1995226.1 nitroreductase [Paenibacillus eucommiae]
MSSEITPEIEEHRQPDHEIHPQFLTRWSPRAFSNQEVPNDVLLSLFEAARWAPSSGNSQPWRFIIARNAEDRAKFHSFINPSNLVWCDKAPVLVVVASQSKNAQGDTIRTHAFDAGTSWGYLALEASNQGLITHAMAGFNPDAARTALEVPEDYEIYAVIAIGYRGSKLDLPEKLQEREIPSNRRSVEESCFEGGFGKQL